MSFANQYLNLQWTAIVITHQLNWQFTRKCLAVVFLLPTVGSQTLNEVAVPIQQSNRDQRQLQVACRLKVISCEDSKATGIKRQRVVHTKLGTKIRDRICRCDDGRANSRPGRTLGHVVLEKLIKTTNPLEIN